MIMKLPYVNLLKKSGIVVLSLLLLLASSSVAPTKTWATGNLTALSIQPSNSTPSATAVTYTVGFTLASTTTLECIQVQFATTTGMGTAATGMTTASGFTLTGGGLTQANWTNYTGTNGTLEIYATSAQTPTATAATITWTGVTNTSITNPTNVYAQITTYTTETSTGATCSTAVDQSIVMAQLFTSGVSASVTVPSSLSFTVANYGSAVNGSGDTGFVTTTATTIPFGSVSGGTTGVGSQTLTVGTNAKSGYTLYAADTQQLKDTPGDILADTSGTNAAPAAFSGSTTTSAFGYTTDGAGESQFTSNTWAKLTTTNLGVATRATAQASDATHVEYKVEPSNTQAPGTYTTTVYYTAVPSY